MTIRAKLRDDLVLVEQTYRGEQSYIVKDPQTRKYFRFRPAEVMVMGMLDGEHTPAEAAAALLEEGLRVSAAGVEAFARKLGSMGLCERTLRERSVLQMERLRAERRRRIKPSLFQGDLLRLRWSVGDPDKFFDRWMPRLAFFFSRPFIIASLALFAIYLLILGLKWPEFSRTLADLYSLNVDASTLLVFWLSGTFIIVVHELGHGFTCKHFGGQVHEIGAMLIYFEPAFFCNVNDAWTFPELRSRLWVTAAGSWIQLVIASLAAIVWWAAAPGTVLSEAAFAAVLIGGFTTVLMNANPLIPLDGYYALSDYLEVPNLRQRAFAYLGWLVKTRVLRLELPQPPADMREQRVFVIYAILAIVYITMILTFVAATVFGWLSRWLGAVGVLVFAVALFAMLRGPIQSGYRTLRLAMRQQDWSSPIRKGRRFLLIGLPVVLVVGALVPWPIVVTGRFTAAPLFSMPHAAPDSGIVQRVMVREGTRVSAGAPLFHIRNLPLERELITGQRVSDSLAVRSAEARGLGRYAAAAEIDAERAVEEARLAGLKERAERLRIRARGKGVVVTPRPQELTGRWVSNGEIVLQLGQADSVEIRIPLDQAGGTLIRPGAPVRLLPDATLHQPGSGHVASVSTAAKGADAVEVRLRVPAAEGLLPGMTGRASVTLRNSNLWGALWWNIRRGVRTDIFL